MANKFPFKVGEMICFTKDIYSYDEDDTEVDFFGRGTFVEANEPVKLLRITPTSIIVEREDGKTKMLRNIPGRMYPNTKLGRMLYGK